MSENIKENEQVCQPISSQAPAVDEVQEALERLKIHPRRALGSLSHLRIDRARIKPIDSQARIMGGTADVEAAILTPIQHSSSSESDVTEYVALKKLRLDIGTDCDRALAPLAREVDLLNDLSHDNVVKIIGFVEEADDGVAWMVFAWEKNGNLREFVRSANWELPELVSLVCDVARGLSYLHGRNPPICHGDLKSLNILVNSKHRAVITDFGSARSTVSTTDAVVSSISGDVVTTIQRRTSTGVTPKEPLKAEVTATGQSITMTGPAWTVRWAAPELLDEALPSLGSDVWAFGWICWEAVTGNFPFDGEHDAVVIWRIVTRDLPTIRNNAQLGQIKTLCSLMEECWRLDANKRPTATRCHQALSFMNQTIPSGIAGNDLATTRSSGLLHALGWIQISNSNGPKAEEYFRQSLDAAKSVGDEQGQARALHGIGQAYRAQTHYSNAEELFIQSGDLFSKIGDQLGVALSVEALGEVYCIRNEYPKAEESYIQSRDLFSKIGHQLGFAKSVKSLGEVYHRRNELSKAEELFIQSRDVHSKIGNQLGVAQSIKALGDVYLMRSEYSRAEESYIRSRDLCSKIGDQIALANSLHGLGSVYFRQNDYSKAEASYIESRDLYSKLGNQLLLARPIQGLGDVYRMRKEYSKAEESYVQSRDLYSKMGDQSGVAQVAQGLGEMYRMQIEYSKADESFIQSRDLFSKIGHQLGFAYSARALGDLYSIRNDDSRVT
ncbi:hypothetical protein FS837_005317, partial [Tulasnella sp. UAMH 9824]